MNPPPQRGRPRYGSAQQAGQHAQQQFPFVVDPTEVPGAAVRAFFPAPGAGEPPPSSSSADHAPGQHGHRYGGGGGAEISLAHAGQGHGAAAAHHRYHQFGVEPGRQDGASSASLPRHSSSPPGFFSSPVVDNGRCRLPLSLHYCVLASLSLSLSLRATVLCSCT
jgi:hypothetical protein